MEPTNENRSYSTQQDELDRVLDAVLAKYAAVEPRPGLDDRVLAHLRVAPPPPNQPAWLQWGLAAAVAAIAVIAVFTWRFSQAPHPRIAERPKVAIQWPLSHATTSAPHAGGEVATAKHASRRKLAARHAPASTAVAPPKLDQFPSPQPLSTEEIALAQYVKHFPQEARLVAEAQAEFELETQRQMNDAGADTRPSGSIQQER